MLGLKLATDPRWVDVAGKSIEEVLVDHAYCEQKAATNCISIIINFPDEKVIVDKLAPIVTEEWGHFRMVIRELDKRGLQLGVKRKDDYVKMLSKVIITGGDRNNQLVERLLLAALIEARSCERFKILSENLIDNDLKEFYRELMVSEAGHYRLFIDLAKLYWPEEKVKAKFNYYLQEEAKILNTMTVRGDRVH
jgi:tRNA-(ms[2]io[6]A)-hydroxylase